MTTERRNVAHKTSAPKSEGIQIISRPLLPTILLGVALFKIMPSKHYCMQKYSVGFIHHQYFSFVRLYSVLIGYAAISS